MKELLKVMNSERVDSKYLTIKIRLCTRTSGFNIRFGHKTQGFYEFFENNKDQYKGLL